MHFQQPASATRPRCDDARLSYCATAQSGTGTVSGSGWRTVHDRCLPNAAPPSCCPPRPQRPCRPCPAPPTAPPPSPAPPTRAACPCAASTPPRRRTPPRTRSRCPCCAAQQHRRATAGARTVVLPSPLPSRGCMTQRLATRGWRALPLLPEPLSLAAEQQKRGSWGTRQERQRVGRLPVPAGHLRRTRSPAVAGARGRRRTHQGPARHASARPSRRGLPHRPGLRLAGWAAHLRRRRRRGPQGATAGRFRSRGQAAALLARLRPLFSQPGPPPRRPTRHSCIRSQVRWPVGSAVEGWPSSHSSGWSRARA